MKKWYQSKTVWVNFIAIGSAFILSNYGVEIDQSTQALALAGVNVILRAITHEEISW